MKISMKWFSIIGIILFIIVLLNTDLKKLWEIMLGIKPIYIILSLILFCLSLAVRSWKWKVLINLFNKDYTIWQAFKSYTLGVAFGSVTPGKAGDLIKVLDLKKVIGMETKQGISLSIFDKIIDLLILFGAGLICLIIISVIFSEKINLTWIIALLVIVLSLAVFFLTKPSRKIFNHILSSMKFIPQNIRDKILEIYNTFFDIIGAVGKNKNFINYLFLTILSWLMLFSIPYFYAKSISLNVSIYYILLFIPVTLSIEVLPITMLGIGTRDATMILLFSLISITKEQSVILSMMFLVFANFPIILIGFYIGWKNKYTIDLGSIKEKLQKPSQ